jgi:hypothetical protein
VALSIYEIVIPTIIHGLKIMDQYLDHAQELERQDGLSNGTVLQAKLAQDMIPLGEQFSVICDKVDRHVSALRQQSTPTPQVTHMNYPEIRRRLTQTIARMNEVTEQELADASSHVYNLNSPVFQGIMRGDDYVRHLLLPDFFFHLATVHGILRHMGAPIGKRDYLGDLSFNTGGYS